MINHYHNLPNSKCNYMGYHNSWHNKVKVYVHQVSAAGKHKVMPLLVLYKPTQLPLALYKVYLVTWYKLKG